MSESVTLDLLSTELGRLSAQIGDQQEALASGSAAEKVQAAGDLAELKQRATDIQARLQRLAEGRASADNDIKTGIELEVRDLADTLERWLTADIGMPASPKARGGSSQPSFEPNGEDSMADLRDPQSDDPAPTSPKRPLPGQDANFPGQPPIVDIDEGSPNPQRPARRGGNEGRENPDDGSGDRSEGGHIESAKHVERELPADNGSPDR